MTDDQPIDGARLLDKVRDLLRWYVVIPTSEATDAVALWVAATHGLSAFEHAPRLSICAPEKRCGKSRLLDVIEATCWRPLATVNASTAAVIRSIDGEHPPTLLIDEADALWGSKQDAESNEDLRALLNAGHQRGRPALRVSGPNHEVKKFPTFAMAALAGIGNLPDTIADRSVPIRMRRRTAGEEVHPYRRRRDEKPLNELGRHLTAWVRGSIDVLTDAEPAMPVEDRAADTWEPLVAVADLAGRDWPDRARNAVLALTADASEPSEQSIGVRLLADIATVFTDAGRPAEMSTDALLTALRKLPEAPWDAFNTTAQRLSYLLKDYSVKPCQVRPGGGDQVRGYKWADFIDPITRYVPPAD